MVKFTAHLSLTITRLTRYKQKVVLAAMLEGKSMPSKVAKAGGGLIIGCRFFFFTDRWPYNSTGAAYNWGPYKKQFTVF